MSITPHDRKRIRQLFAVLGSQYAGERETAWAKLDELLRKNRLTWNDLAGLLAASDDSSVDATDANGSVDDHPPVGTPNALELVHLLQQFVDLKSPAEYVGVALWVLHTFVFDRFQIRRDWRLSRRCEAAERQRSLRRSNI